MEKLKHIAMNNMEIILLALCAYFVSGGIISYFYMKKIEKIFFNYNGRYPHEACTGIVGGVMVVGWIFLLPYECFTKFKGWKKQVD